MTHDGAVPLFTYLGAGMPHAPLLALDLLHQTCVCFALKLVFLPKIFTVEYVKSDGLKVLYVIVHSVPTIHMAVVHSKKKMDMV